MDLTESRKEKDQDYKRDVAKGQFSAPLNKLEPRRTGEQVHYHSVI
jgi:hypothetical protein